MSRARLPVLERLERHIERVDSGCWVWIAYTHKGYGVTMVGWESEGTLRRVLVHRLMYELLVGPIPKGLDLDHLCRVRACCNPAHLEPVTHRENVMRGQSLTARKAAQTHCIHGHPFDAENTYFAPNGKRHCKTCSLARNRATRQRAKQRAARAIEAVLADAQ